MPSPARSRCLQVRDELERRLAELEPYPDLLSATERRLRDASDLLRQYEQRHLANVEHITQLTSKVTHLTDGALLATNTPLFTFSPSLLYTSHDSVTHSVYIGPRTERSKRTLAASINVESSSKLILCLQCRTAVA